MHTDHLGTPQAVTDQNQLLVWRARYSPFGSAILETAAITNPLRFPGQYYDEETGLHYNYFRTYDPSTGRYLEADPIGLDGGMNLYLYGNANPLTYTDPLGLDPAGAAIGGQIGARGGAVIGGGLGSLIGPEGTVAGAIIGSRIGRAAGAAAGSKIGDMCKDDPCPPCKTVSGKVVPVGTIAYRPLDTPSKPEHGIVGPHYNVYKANQIPAPNCDCFWQSIGAVPPSALPSGAIPIEPFAK